LKFKEDIKSQMCFIFDILHSLIRFIEIFIIIAVILSWIPPHNKPEWGWKIEDLAEYILGPFRRYIPPIGPVDITPLVVLILLEIIDSLIPRCVVF